VSAASFNFINQRKAIFWRNLADRQASLLLQMTGQESEIGQWSHIQYAKYIASKRNIFGRKKPQRHGNTAFKEQLKLVNGFER
jgi:hypothetical protein